MALQGVRTKSVNRSISLVYMNRPSMEQMKPLDRIDSVRKMCCHGGGGEIVLV